MAEEEASPDFKYIVRLANTDLDGNRPMVLALTGIKGIGLRLANIVTDMLGVSRTAKIGDLADDRVEELATILDTLPERVPGWALNRRRDYWTGEDVQLTGANLELRRREDVNRLKMIRAYRGIRHETGQKVRGQRTRSNGRSGLSVGVVRKAVVRAAAEESGKS